MAAARNREVRGRAGYGGSGRIGDGRIGGSGIAGIGGDRRQLPNLRTSAHRESGESGDATTFRWTHGKANRAAKGKHDQSEPNSSAIRCPKPLQRLQQRRPATLGACRASIRARNDTGRLSPGPALTPSRCPRLLRQAAASRSAANAPPKRRTGYRRATLAPQHRSAPQNRKSPQLSHG